MNTPQTLSSSSPDTLPEGFTHRQLTRAISPKIQEFILFPTEKCNFRCTYCYEDFEIGKMSSGIQRGIEKLLERRIPDLKLLSFSWFGGEPLLAKDVVLRLSRFAKQLCLENGVNFRGGLTTNAYLLDFELASQLLEVNQNFFQVTLDGTAEQHNKLRRRADGAGTFDTIWQNLDAMRNLEGDFDCQIRLHLRRDNIDDMTNLVREIAGTFGADQRFRMDFQHLRDMGGEGGKSVFDPLSYEETVELEKTLRQAYLQKLAPTLEVSTKDLNNALIDIPTLVSRTGESAGSQRREDMIVGEPYICYAAKPNSLIVRANGRIGKCTVALSDERNDLGYLSEEGELILNDKKLHPWMRGLETLDPKVAGCPLSGMPKEILKSPVSPTSRVIMLAEI